MENDVLKNKIAPWQEKGRWYKITLDFSTGTPALVQNESDIGTSITGASNIVGTNFKRVCFVAYDMTFKNATSSGNYTWNFVQLHSTSGTDSTSIHLNLASALNDSVKKAVIYIFGELA